MLSEILTPTLEIPTKETLPDFIRRALYKDGYTKGSSRYSITDLIGPPQIRVLKEKYADQLPEPEPDDLVDSFTGTAVHEKVERANEGLKIPEVLERRLYARIRGELVSGALDCYHGTNTHIYDIKNTKVSKLVWSDYDSWVKQLNSYACLSRVNGFPVDKLSIVVFLKDWELKKAETDLTYPQKKLMLVHLPVWDEQFAINYLDERVRIHLEADADVTKHPCSDSDRWRQNLRCKKYCQVSKFCQQFNPKGAP